MPEAVLDRPTLTQSEIQTLRNDLAPWSEYLLIKQTPEFVEFMLRPEKIICFFCLDGEDFLYASNGCIEAREFSVGQNSLAGHIKTNRPFEDDVYEVTFSNGNKVKCNLEHPFWWIPYKKKSAGEWKPLKEILAKDKITHGSKYGYVYFAEASEFKLDTVELKSPRLLGYLCSDGYVIGESQSIKFTNNNEKFLGEVERLVGADFPVIDCKRYKKNNGYDILLTQKSANYSGNELKNFIRSLNITKDSYGKILSGDSEGLREFVRGFFNGDGYLLIRQRKNGYGKTPHVEIGFCIGNSNRKAHEFQYILWKLGITSYICKERFKSSTGEFCRVKVNQTSIKDCLSILENTKYPEKFERAEEVLALKPEYRHKYRNWVSIKKIEHVGRKVVSGISTESGELFGVCGMKTHNTGNQWGKNVNIVKHYIMRIMGKHPIESKNMRPGTRHRVIRFCSEKLPMEKEGEETKNTIYPVFKRMLPKAWIKKDISQRSQTMTLRDPQGGPDLFIEFVSYEQDLQAQAGVQRFSVYIDENCPKAFFEEQIPRLLASDGDLLMGMTPALGSVTWQFEDLFERASAIYRSKKVRARLKERFDETFPKWQITDNATDIAVFMCATDDNPLYDQLVEEKNGRDIALIETGKHPLYKTVTDFVPVTKDEYITQKLGFYDTDSEDVRRYGIFRQVAGRMYKDFDSGIHVIDKEKYFPDDIPHGWMHGRGIDYHQSTPWHCTFISISPQNEAFVYNESVLSPEKYITAQICRDIAEKSRDYSYPVNRIDPLANQMQVNTGITTVEDINRIFYEFKRDGVGTGGYWVPWDTKSTRGREEVRERIKNSRMCGKPFNNKGERGELLPTIWFMSDCRVTIDSMKNWRHDESAVKSLETKDPKESFIQKWSHICMAIECLFKESGFRARPDNLYIPPRRNTAAQYGRRA